MPYEQASWVTGIISGDPNGCRVGAHVIPEGQLSGNSPLAVRLF
jgi:hypothetical protein